MLPRAAPASYNRSPLAQVTDQVASSPGITPGVLMVDGNDILHPRLCGTACHVALTTGLPTLGVAKNLHCIDQVLPLVYRLLFTHGALYCEYCVQRSTLSGTICGKAEEVAW